MLFLFIVVLICCHHDLAHARRGQDDYESIHDFAVSGGDAVHQAQWQLSNVQQEKHARYETRQRLLHAVNFFESVKVYVATSEVNGGHSLCQMACH